MIDSKLQQDLREKYNPDGSTLRKAQLRMAEMLVFLDKVCTEYKLRYWLAFGTLLGAERHGGFIPWDDDTDICMPIEDLHKLKKIMATEHLSDEFVMQTPENDKNYMRIEWCVLRDLKSEYIQNNRFHNGLKYRGIQVDIFPVELGVRHKLKTLVDGYQSVFVNRFVLGNIVPYKIGIQVAKLCRKIESRLIIPIFRSFNKRTSNYYCLAYGVPIKFKTKINNVYPLKKETFEGYLLNVPCNPDAYLTGYYGNWRKIPSPDEISTHDVKIKFYDKPVYKI